MGPSLTLWILACGLLAGPRAFAAADASSPLLGTWEYRQRNSSSVTGFDAEGERLELTRKGDSIQGLYFGLEREGDHGLFYTLAVVEGLDISEGGGISFIVPGRVLFAVRPGSLEEIEEVRRHAYAGFTRYELRFRGQLQDGRLILQCVSDRNDCPEDRMVFRKGRWEAAERSLEPSRAPTEPEPGAEEEDPGPIPAAVLRQICASAACRGPLAFLTVYRTREGAAAKLLFRGDIRSCSHPPDVFYDLEGRELAVVGTGLTVPGSAHERRVREERDEQTRHLTPAETLSCPTLGSP